MSTWEVTTPTASNRGTANDPGATDSWGQSADGASSAQSATLPIRRWYRMMKLIALVIIVMVMVPVLIVLMFAVALVLLGVKLITGELTLVTRWVGWGMQKVGQWLTDDGRRNVRVVR
jgi:hypothetical protein